MRIVFLTGCVLLIVGLVLVHTLRLEGLRYERLAMKAANICDAHMVYTYSLQGLEANPCNINLHNSAGAGFTVLRQWDKAISHLEIFLKYYPNNINALINSYQAYKHSGNMPKSQEMLKRLAKIKPSYVKKG